MKALTTIRVPPTTHSKVTDTFNSIYGNVGLEFVRKKKKVLEQLLGNDQDMSRIKLVTNGLDLKSEVVYLDGEKVGHFNYQTLKFVRG
jgi:hypothetical protein